MVNRNTYKYQTITIIAFIVTTLILVATNQSTLFMYLYGIRVDDQILEVEKTRKLLHQTYLNTVLSKFIIKIFISIQYYQNLF